MKELDILFEAFLERQRQTLLNGGWPQLETLLEQEDDMIFDWLSGRDLPADPDQLALIEALTDAP